MHQQMLIPQQGLFSAFPVTARNKSFPPLSSLHIPAFCFVLQESACMLFSLVRQKCLEVKYFVCSLMFILLLPWRGLNVSNAQFIFIHWVNDWKNDTWVVWTFIPLTPKPAQVSTWERAHDVPTCGCLREDFFAKIHLKFLSPSFFFLRI